MKKLFIFAAVILAVIPAMAFADFQIGGVAMYKGDVSEISNGITLNDFTFGLDTRLNISILQGSLAAVYYPEDLSAVVPLPPSLTVLTDIGLCFDVLFLRLGAGVGPNFYIALANTPGSPQDAVPIGLNFKLAADINIGSFAIGLVGYWYMSSISDFTKPNFFDYTRPWVGVSALFKLF